MDALDSLPIKVAEPALTGGLDARFVTEVPLFHQTGEAE